MNRQAGDRLRTRAHEERLDTFGEPELGRRIENGENIAREEMPFFSEPDEVPFSRAQSA